MRQQPLFEVAPPPAPALEPLPESRRVELVPIRTKSALVAQRRGTPWFDWSVNPYRGCEFACDYCYARYSHEFLGHEDPADFQDHVYVKQGFAEALRRDLRKLEPGDHVAFGTATDPYQPVERRERVTRRALTVLAGVEGLEVSVTTKSQLVTRDLDVLRRIARKNLVRVNVTITTPDRRLARFLEPRAPDPIARFRAVKEVRAAGVHAGIFLMPVLPGVTDAAQDLERMFRWAAAAGAEYVVHQVVFLREPSRSYFLRELRRGYPRVAARYHMCTRTHSRLPEKVRREVAGRVHEIGGRYGVPSRLDEPAPAGAGLQRTFPFARDV